MVTSFTRSSFHFKHTFGRLDWTVLRESHAFLSPRSQGRPCFVMRGASFRAAQRLGQGGGSGERLRREVAAVGHRAKHFVDWRAEARGCLIDVSSGGNWVAQKTPVRPRYQVQGHANWRHDNMITPVLTFLAGSVRGGNQEGTSGHHRGLRRNDHDVTAGE